MTVLGLDVSPRRLAVARLSDDGVVEYTACSSIIIDPPRQIRGVLSESCFKPPVAEPGSFIGQLKQCYEPQLIRAEQPFLGPNRNVNMKTGAVMARVEDACRGLWPWAVFEWVTPVVIYKSIGGAGRLPKSELLKGVYRQFAEGKTGRGIRTQDECDAVCVAWGGVDE